MANIIHQIFNIQHYELFVIPCSLLFCRDSAFFSNSVYNSRWRTQSVTINRNCTWNERKFIFQFACAKTFTHRTICVHVNNFLFISVKFIRLHWINVNVRQCISYFIFKNVFVIVVIYSFLHTFTADSSVLANFHWFYAHQSVFSLSI